jgi:hypothetical protein
LKEWLLTPDLYEFQQNLSFSTGNKGGFGLQVYDRLVKGYVYSCSGGPSSKLQLPKDESRAGTLLNILENCRAFILNFHPNILSMILKLLLTDVLI